MGRVKGVFVVITFFRYLKSIPFNDMRFRDQKNVAQFFVFVSFFVHCFYRKAENSLDLFVSVEQASYVTNLYDIFT